MKKETRAREIALQALYQFDLARKAGRASDGVKNLEAFVAASTQDARVAEHASRLIDRVIAGAEELDARIMATVEHWALGRIAAVDRSILRIALVELLEMEEVPPKVAIDEAIELAKKFSTAQSGAFVNGVLDRIYQERSSGNDV